MPNEKAITHFESIRADIRDEMKKRIEQRDKYSIQLTITLSAIIGIAFSKPEYRRVLLVAPMLSIYFTILISYSYRIHAVLASYLRDELEPKLAELCGTERELEWEYYYQHHEVPGVRKSFFLITVVVVSVLNFVYLFIVDWNDGLFRNVLFVALFAYLNLTCDL